MPSAAPPPPKPATKPHSKFTIAAGVRQEPQRVVIYGAGGVGKSTLAAMAPDPVFLDVEGGSNAMDVPRVGGIETWSDLRDALHEKSLWSGCKTIVLDSATAAEELCISYVLAHVKNGTSIATSIESYGFGRGFKFSYEEFNKILVDLDSHIRDGRNVCVIAHETVVNSPNPAGDDFKQWCPRLQAANNASIRERVRDWCDHLLHVRIDMNEKDGKAKSKKTRTIYPQGGVEYWAKSRTLRTDELFLENEDPIWHQITGATK